MEIPCRIRSKNEARTSSCVQGKYLLYLPIYHDRYTDGYLWVLYCA